GATLDAGGTEGIGRAGGARSRAGLIHVAGTGRRAAHRPGIARAVLAGHARPVALVRRAWIAVGGACGAVRLLGVGRADGARSRAGLVHVAGTGRRAAHRPGIARGVLAGRARPVALVRRAWIAVGGACGAVRLLGVGRAGRTVPGT